MKSIITDEEIKPDELWIWDPIKKIYWPEILEEGQRDFNNKCRQKDCPNNGGSREVFSIKLPDGTGYVNLCIDCLIKLCDPFYHEVNRCPQCNFRNSIFHCEGGKVWYECQWGHEWEPQKGESNGVR